MVREGQKRGPSEAGGKCLSGEEAAGLYFHLRAAGGVQHSGPEHALNTQRYLRDVFS